ncbi:molybdenum cofactor guanylyltransferase [Sphingobium nicotianae]|uniref:Molybdenum cofactor guanylyltransferase n=1 Tax=Sphingobium nicotianae TaxID=2782607 RepID=A0A9X1IR99_9SPHN|nr:molybdenum cofactor guanylyltransferase [Sphingobium nicotianae]MBT2187050.1 molybdenum cofactor guanylyltransferase [Sphingobium nicotianae]
MSCCAGLLGIDRAVILGAVIAGGKSTRFGSDKALATLHGRTLIDQVIETLAPQCAEMIVVGREHPGLPGVPDQPAPGLGPLAGIAAALLEAQARGYSAVLTVPCDAFDLPGDLTGRLFPYPAYVESLPVVGLWPAYAAADALAILESEEKHSIKGFAARISARAVQLPRAPANINTAADLERVERHGI